jgi:serine/threonine protein phosphatase PrpC
VDLSFDQKPDTPEEMIRIKAMGGHVTPSQGDGSPSRVWHNLRGLAMARSIGDHNAATVGVIAKPEVLEFDIVDEDVFMIVASDGVWEMIDSQGRMPPVSASMVG